MSNGVSLNEFLDQAEGQENAPAAPAGDIGAVLLGLLPCQEALSGLTGRLPSFVGVQFTFSFGAFPAAFAGQLVATIWRLPAGQHRLELGLLDFAGEALAESRTEATLDQPTVYVALHRLRNAPLATPGLYVLAARCNGVVLGSVPIGVEQGG